MKAIILNHECASVDVVSIPQKVESAYLEEQDTEAVYEYLHDRFNYGEFVPFMLVDDDCPIYDCSEDSEDIETPIYVIR